MSFPCTYCGVNAWTPCKHREAAPRPPEPSPEPEDGRTKNREGMGYNFRAKRYAKFHQSKD